MTNAIKLLSFSGGHEMQNTMNTIVNNYERKFIMNNSEACTSDPLNESVHALIVLPPPANFIRQAKKSLHSVQRTDSVQLSAPNSTWRGNDILFNVCPVDFRPILDAESAVNDEWSRDFLMLGELFLNE